MATKAGAQPPKFGARLVALRDGNAEPVAASLEGIEVCGTVLLVLGEEPPAKLGCCHVNRHIVGWKVDGVPHAFFLLNLGPI